MNTQVTSPPPMSVRKKRDIYVALTGDASGRDTSPASGNFVPVGVISFFPRAPGKNEHRYCTHFTYAPSYAGPAIDPVHLNYQLAGKRVFDLPESLEESGLFRVFGDCVPQQRARQLLAREHPETRGFSEIELLDWLSSGRNDESTSAAGFSAGGLMFFSIAPGHERPLTSIASVREVATKTILELAGMAVKLTLPEIAASITHGGIRPKTTYHDVTGEIGPKGQHYLVKFNSADDGFNSARVEHGTSLLAEIAGINVPKTIVLGVSNNGVRIADIFLTERYDRPIVDGVEHHRHRISLFSLIGDKRARFQNSADYLDILQVIREVSSQPDADSLEIIRRMLFNIGANITDDHLKNHEFVHDRTANSWRLAPAYDLVPNRSNYPHSTSIAGYDCGSLSDDFLRKISSAVGIDIRELMQIRDEVIDALNQRERIYTDLAKCDSVDMNMLRNAYSQSGRRASRRFGFGPTPSVDDLPIKPTMPSHGTPPLIKLSTSSLVVEVSTPAIKPQCKTPPSIGSPRKPG